MKDLVKEIKRLDLWASPADEEANRAWGHLGYEVLEILDPEGHPVAGGKRAIVKKGEVVAIVGKNHRLIPNEVFRGYVREAAEELGAVSHKIWETPTQYMETFYLPDTSVGPGGELKLGFAAANSIDGSIAAKFIGYTFRQICRNGAVMAHEKGPSLFRMHTKATYEDFLSNGREMVLAGIQEAIALTEGAIRPLVEVADATVQSDVGLRLLRVIRESRLPKFARPPYLYPEDDKEFEDPTPGMTLWDVYNDVTELLTHQMKEGVRPASVIDYHKDLHRAFATAVIVE